MGGEGTQRKNQSGNVQQNIDRLKSLLGELERAQKLIAAEQLDKANKVLQNLVNKEPNYFAAWFLLGVIASRNNMWMAAASHFGRAAMLNPDDVPTQLNLARAHIAVGALDLGEQTLRKVLAHDPKNVPAYRALAKAKNEDRDYFGAAQTLETARELEPNNPAILQALGSANMELGNLDEARTHYSSALKHALARKDMMHSLPVILSQFLGLPGEVDLKPLRKIIGQLEKRLPSTGQNFDALQFAKGRLLEKEGDIDAAWNVFSEVNNRIWKQVEATGHMFDARMATSLEYAKQVDVTPSVETRTKSGVGPIPLFIVGGSRSGKTTFERLIGADPQVARGYENRIVETAITRTAFQVGLPKLIDFWYLPENVDDVFASLMTRDLERRANSADIFTITYPGSINHAGRIARNFPRAFFVFMTRNREDQALRCFQKHYRRGNVYSYNWQATLRYLELYEQLADVWLDRLGGRAMRVSYEDLVTDPASVVRAVGERIGHQFDIGENLSVGDDRGCSTPFAPYIPQA